MDVRVGSGEAAAMRNSPAFLELEAKRNRFSWTIAILMLVIYYGFILVIAFDKGLLARDIGGGITLAFPAGLAVILSAVILTGIYVLRANGEFDRLTRQIEEGRR